MLEGHDSLGELSGQWWLAHTKARNEKSLAWDLCELGIPYFLPMVRLERRHGGRRVEVVLPLFPGYVFLACQSEEQRYRVLGTSRIANIIPVHDQPKLRAELEQIRRAVQSPYSVDVYAGLRAGRRCRITAGSLKGLEGVVVTRKNVSRVFLDVSILGQSAVVEIDAMLLEPIE